MFNEINEPGETMCTDDVTKIIIEPQSNTSILYHPNADVCMSVYAIVHLFSIILA